MVKTLSRREAAFLQAHRPPARGPFLDQRRAEDRAAGLPLPQPRCQDSARHERGGRGARASPEPEGHGFILLILSGDEQRSRWGKYEREDRRPTAGQEWWAHKEPLDA